MSTFLSFLSAWFHRLDPWNCDCSLSLFSRSTCCLLSTVMGWWWGHWETVWGRGRREDAERRLERWLQTSRDGDWIEVSFSHWQPLRDDQTEMWPRSQLSSSHFLSLLSVESLSRPFHVLPFEATARMWDLGLAVLPLFCFLFLSACWGRPTAQRTQWWPTVPPRPPSRSTMPSFTKKESLCLLCVPTMSELIWAKYSHRIEERGGWFWLRDPTTASRLHQRPSTRLRLHCFSCSSSGRLYSAKIEEKLKTKSTLGS